MGGIKTNASEKFSVYEMRDGKPNLVTYDLKDGALVFEDAACTATQGVCKELRVAAAGEQNDLCGLMVVNKLDERAEFDLQELRTDEQNMRGLSANGIREPIAMQACREDADIGLRRHCAFQSGDRERVIVGEQWDAKRVMIPRR